MWDLVGSALRPVLVVGPQSRGSVKGVGVLEDLGLLAVAYSSGKVGGCGIVQ